MIEVVVEELLEGEEASFFVISDGTNALPLATAQDHKRALDGDRQGLTGKETRVQRQPGVVAIARAGDLRRQAESEG